MFLPFVSQTPQSVARKPISEVWAFMRPYWGEQRLKKGKPGGRGQLNETVVMLKVQNIIVKMCSVLVGRKV